MEDLIEILKYLAGAIAGGGITFGGRRLYKRRQHGSEEARERGKAERITEPFTAPVMPSDCDRNHDAIRRELKQAITSQAEAFAHRLGDTNRTLEKMASTTHEIGKGIAP